MATMANNPTSTAEAEGCGAQEQEASPPTPPCSSSSSAADGNGAPASPPPGTATAAAPSASHVDLVRSTWTSLPPSAAASVSDRLCDEILRIDPDRTGALVPADPTERGEQRGKRIQEAIGTSVDGLGEFDALVAKAADLLTSTSDRPWTPADHANVGGALLDALKEAVGEGWDEATEEAWAVAYGRLGEAAMEAAQKRAKEEEAEGSSAADEPAAAAPTASDADAQAATPPLSAPAVRIAVIGCGWWSQGWHLPHLAANGPGVVIAAVVDADPNPVSTLSSSPLLPLPDLAEKYGCPYFSSVAELLASATGPTLDGVVVATSHASHFDVGMSLLNEGVYRRQVDGMAHRAMNVLMEKPMTTDVDEARKLWEASARGYPEGAFIINHTASYRPQTAVARHIVGSGQLGRIRHISATMNGPLMWLFGDGRNCSWVSKTPWRKTSSCSSEDSAADDGKPPMTGNGYAWGQIAHVLAWIYAVLGADASDPEDGEAVPAKVYCVMSHASDTGADVSLAAAITCRDGATFSVTGTALLPGSQYADPPVGKHVRVELFGERGSLMYGGDDRISQSGRLELRRTAPGQREDGQSEFPCADLDWSDVLRDASELKDGFYFEDGEQSGTGPGSMESFLDACRASSTRFSEGMESPRTLANDSLIGLRTVQIIDAMYRSSISGSAEEINGYG